MTSIKTNLEDKKLKKEEWENDVIEILIEPRRLWSHQVFLVNANGSRGHLIFGGKQNYQWEASTYCFNDRWSVTVKIPFASLDNDRESERPIRVNIGRRIPPEHEGQKNRLQRWISPHMLKSRLLYDANNPADFGWMVFI